jgi:hypothetical protein
VCFPGRPQFTRFPFRVSWGRPGLVNPSERLQSTQAGPKLDGAGLAGTGILLFEQVSGCGWDRHRMTASD